jgi:hypothetical protein
MHFKLRPMYVAEFFNKMGAAILCATDKWAMALARERGKQKIKLLLLLSRLLHVTASLPRRHRRILKREEVDVG